MARYGVYLDLTYSKSNVHRDFNLEPMQQLATDGERSRRKARETQQVNGTQREPTSY